MKKYQYWLLAVVVTLALSIYQRMTGPTYPKKVTVELADGSSQLRLPRSGVQHDEVLLLKGVPQTAKAQLHYRRYPTAEPYTTVDFDWREGGWQAVLPVQPVGGKLQYTLTIDGKEYPADEPVVLRFRNDVPATILVPHILLMFAAMLLAVYTFLLVVTRRKYRRWLKITVLTLFVGGFVFGPLVQHAAFGPWWTGFPYGTDLTDNKTLLAFLVFLAALVTMRWKYNKLVVAFAVLFMIAIFTIPHSAFGSEYDYTTQQLGTGR